MAPGGLVSDVRLLRNKLEHYYSIPSEIEAGRAIEIAELFVAATEKKLMDFWGFELTDDKHKDASEFCKISGLYVSESIGQQSMHGNITILYYCPFSHKDYRVIVSPQDPSHAAIVRMCISHDQEYEFRRSLVYLLKINQHEIPSEKVNVKMI